MEVLQRGDLLDLTGGITRALQSFLATAKSFIIAFILGSRSDENGFEFSSKIQPGSKKWRSLWYIRSCVQLSYAIYITALAVKTGKFNKKTNCT